HPGEAEGAVAEQQADLALGVGELGADRLAGAGAEAAGALWSHPVARLPAHPADLALGVGELGADRLAGAGAEAAVGPWIHPGARLPGLPDPAREADEVAAVADHDRVAVEEVAELAVDPHRVERGAI